MTLLELVKHLRESILDDTGGSGVDWTSITEDSTDAYQLRWSNEELTRLINDAQNRACRASFLLKSSSSDYAITVASGTATYSLDSRIIKIKGAYLASNGTELIPTEFEDLMNTPRWRDKTGIPTHYIADIDTGEITLYPEPSANDTVNLIIYRLPTEQFSWDFAEIQSSELKLEHQIEMLSYAASLAYLKDEANTFDPQRSEYFRQLFEKHFTNTSAYGDVRRSRTRNRSIRYRDIF